MKVNVYPSSSPVKLGEGVLSGRHSLVQAAAPETTRGSVLGPDLIKSSCSSVS